MSDDGEELDPLRQYNNLFSSLEPEIRNNLLSKGQRLYFSQYETIYKENSVSDAIYIIEEGSISLSYNVSGVVKEFYHLEPGDIFGVEEIFSHQRRKYNAISLTNYTALKRLKYSDILALNSPDFHSSLKRIIEKNLEIDFFKNVEVFTQLNIAAIKKIKEKVKNLSYKKGDIVVQEGDTGDSLFIIKSGSVQVLINKNNKKYPISNLKTYDLFGEIALFEKDSIRKADVICLEDTEIYQLKKDDFEILISLYPEIKDYFLQKIDLYVKKEEIQDSYFDNIYSEQTEEELVTYHNGLPLVSISEKIEQDIACLAMIFSYHKKDFSFSKLQDILTNLHAPDLITAMAETSEYYDLFPKLININDPRLIKKLSLPAIGVFNDERLFVLYKIQKKSFILGIPFENKIKVYSEKDFFDNWSGIALEVRKFPEPSMSDKKEKSNRFISILGKYYPYFSKNKKIIFEIFLIAIILEMLGLINPYLIQIIIDNVLVNHSYSLLLIVISSMIMIAVFSSSIQYLRDILTIRFGNKIDIPLLIKFYQHTFNLKIKHIEEMKVGEIVNRFNENHKIKSLITGSTIGIFLDLMLSFIYIIAMFSYSATLTFYVLGIIAIFALTTLVTTPILKKNDKKAYNLANDYNSLLVESIQGINVIKTMSLEKNNFKKFQKSYLKTVKQSSSNSSTELIIHTFTGLVNSISGLVLLWLGAKLIISGQMTLGQLMGFNALFGSVISPIMNSINMIDTVQETIVVIERLDEVLGKELEEKNKSSLIMLPNNVHGEIEFENVNFGYDPQKKVIDNLSFNVNAGQSIALVGRSGCGKTSLVELIFKFNIPDSGKIKVDGFDITNVSNISLRRIIGYVPQDPFIFSGTIRENISLKNTNAPMEEVIEAAKMADIHNFIESLPLKYNTMIGEIGISLSGGQNQRLAIARALIGNPRILIFDEATSALDTESEKSIQENMSKIMQGRTTFIIAHRLSTIKNVDLIFVLDEGKIVEKGTHSELLQKQGLYYSLNTNSIST